MKSRKYYSWLLLFLGTTTDDSHAFASNNRHKNRNNKSIKNSKGFDVKVQSQKQKYEVDTSEATTKLLRFLEEEEAEGMDVLDIGFSNHQGGLRGIFAKDNILKGEYICAVPFVSTILINETFLSKDDEDNDDRLLHAIEFQNNILDDEKQVRKWKPYLDCLPTHNKFFDATPDFWSPSEIQQLQIPSLANDMLDRKQQLYQIAKQNLQQAFSSHDDDVESFAKKLQFAAWLVQSRAFTTFKEAIQLDPNGGSNEISTEEDTSSITKEGLLKRTVLIPFLDFLNHASTSNTKGANTELEVVETKVYEESFYALVATRNIFKGEELRTQYGTGHESSIDLFAKYGFIPNDNQHNDYEYLKMMQEEGMEWATSLEEDKQALKELKEEEDGRSSSKVEAEQNDKRIQLQILSLHIYLKELQNSLV